MNTQKLWNEFNKLPFEAQVEILKEYTYYVANFPDDHDEASYPVCFLEWWTNDYQTMLDEIKGKV